MPSYLSLNKTLLAIAVSSAIISGYSQAAVNNEDLTEKVVVTEEYTNNGSIVTSEGEAVSYEAVGLEFTNDGTIQGATHGIAVQTGKRIQLLKNNGTISATNGAAIMAVGDGRIVNIDNSGIITGGMVGGEQIAIDMRTAAETAPMDITMNAGSSISGNIHMNARPTDGVNNSMTTEIFVNAGEGSVNFNGTAITGVNRISIRPDAYLKLAAQNDTIRFDLVDSSNNGTTNNNGSLVFNENSILELELSGALAEDESVLFIDGDLYVKGNSSIHLTGNLEELAGKHTLISVSDDGVIRKDDGKNYTITNGWLTNVEILDDGSVSGDIIVDVTYEESATTESLTEDAMAGGADTTEAAYIGAFGKIALDGTEISKDTITFASNAQSELAALLNNVSGDPAAAARLAGEMTADRSGATIYAAQNAINQNMSWITTRSLEIRNSHSSNHVDYGSSWLNVYGNSGNKDSSGRIDGFDIDGMGISFGTDGMVSNNLYTGFNLSYNQQSMEGVIYGTEHDVNSYQAAAYALWNHDQLFVSTIASAGANFYDSSRNIAGQDAAGKYDGYNLALRVTAGYDFDVAGVAIQPLAAAEVNQLTIEAYEEKGSVASLGYEQQKVEQHKLGLGVNLSKNITFKDSLFKPSLSVMGWHDLNAGEHKSGTYTVVDPGIAIGINDMAAGSDYRYELQAGADYVSDDGQMKAGFNIQYSIEEEMQDTALLFQVKYAL